MTYRHHFKRFASISVLSLVWTLLPFPVSADGLLHVRQTVFGMDCAPCAYGIEQGLLKLKGVKQAHVDLNTGIATIDLAQDNAVTWAEIWNVIREHGFTPKDATATVSGQLKKQGNQYYLAINGVSTYHLLTDQPAMLSNLTVGTEITVDGSISAKNNNTLTLQVSRIAQNQKS